MSETEWYWCLTHERAERVDDRDDPDNALGPYDSPEAAQDWRVRNEDRALKWKLEDEEWTGDQPKDSP